MYNVIEKRIKGTNEASPSFFKSLFIPIANF